MIHKAKKILSLLLALTLSVSLLPLPQSSAAYGNGYSGGMAGNGSGIYAHGVDLSEWQGHDVDFNKIREQGYSFVILRAGFATTIDDTFEQNYARAKEAGLDVGVYVYSYAETVQEALEEAKACKNWIAGKKLEYPVYFDLEDPQTHGSMEKEALSEIALAFLDELAKDGWLVGLYSCLSWLTYKIDTERVCAQYECWMAQYLHSGTFDIYDRYDEVYGMWQYSSTGSVEGIDGGVDLNVCFKDYPSICKQYGFNGYAASGGTIRLTGADLPNVIKTGESFSVSGEIISTKGSLYSVTAGIYDEAGWMLSGRSVSRLGTTYDLSKLADSIQTSTLPEGKYYYRITVSNPYDTSVLLNHALWISDSGIYTENLIAPADLKEGDAFQLSGRILSTEKLQQVRVSVKRESGVVLLRAEAAPDVTEFDLRELQNELDLTALPTGKYVYSVEIYTKGAYHRLISEKFHIWVKNDPLTLNGFSLQSEYYPGELSGLTGTVRSENSEIQLLKVTILNSNGEVLSAAQRQTLGLRYDLSSLDARLDLNELPVGRYRCLITAQNAAGPVTLADVSFLIREDAVSLCEFSAPHVLHQGDSFLLSGAVASNIGTLNYVCVSVYNEDDNCVLWSAAIPNSNVFDLSGLNDKLLFSSLPCGEYMLCVTAENEHKFAQLYEAPFSVTDSGDKISWNGSYIDPLGTAYPQSEPFALWGTLSSESSNLSEVTVEVVNEEGNAVAYAQLLTDSKEISIEDCNEMLRLAALPVASYRLRITATNAQSSYTMLDSAFSITDCRHRNVRGGNAYFASCVSCGAVCDSQCLDCGGKVRGGVYLPREAHEYHNGYCGGCGRAQFLTVKVKSWMEVPQNNERLVIAAKTGENWYALGMDGAAVPIAAPDENGEILVSADLLWTASVIRGKCSVSNPFGRSLHLDSCAISIARGNVNTALNFTQEENAWTVNLLTDPDRYLTYEDGIFGVGELSAEIYLFFYVGGT